MKEKGEEIKEEIVETNQQENEEKQYSPEDVKKRQLIFNYMINNYLKAVSSGKFKSVKRASKRGRLNIFGEILSKRPFNNRKNTSERKNVDSRFINTNKKRIYEARKEKRTHRESVEQSV